ncbi:MAG: hypothetical protein KBH06_01625 [Spirochaetes bacterium]|nr:hypothetical protein [Spirochaetota bacterium]
MIKIILFFPLFFCFISSYAKEETKWGVVFVNGKAAYIDPSQLDMSEIRVPDYIAKRNIIEKKESIKNGTIIWDDNRIIVLDSRTDCRAMTILGTEREFKYKVEFNVMFLSEDGKKWEVLQISVVDDKEKLIGDKYKYPRHMIIHLKCKWFENDYQLIGTIGS